MFTDGTVWFLLYPVFYSLISKRFSKVLLFVVSYVHIHIHYLNYVVELT